MSKLGTDEDSLAITKFYCYECKKSCSGYEAYKQKDLNLEGVATPAEGHVLFKDQERGI